MNNKIKFSILMANYNKGKYIAEAIQSVINQSFKDWELIIVDDCSTDNSLEVIKSYLKDNRIRLLKNRHNKGIIFTHKRLINEAKGAIVGILDSDDAIAKKGALEIMFNQYHKHPDCGYIYSQFVFCDPDLNPNTIGYCKAIPLNETNLFYNCVSHFKTFKKMCYFKTEGYEEEITCAEDKDLVFKMEEHTKLLFVDEILYKYRVLPHSLSNDPIQVQICRVSYILVVYKAYKRRRKTKMPNLSSNDVLNLLFEATRIYIGLSQIKKALLFLSKAFKVNPLKFWMYISRDVLWVKTISRMSSYFLNHLKKNIL